jgi:5-bromo-4-chloroindolyl phosphate hydrolysis protein
MGDNEQYGGLWSRVCKEKSACLYKIGAQIFLPKVLRISKTIYNFVEQNPKNDNKKQIYF